jgi:threonyl-tRNA synthetase
VTYAYFTVYAAASSRVLQRIYGTAWESAEQLAAYQALKAEAARRDHRKLGQELDLFSIQDSAGRRRAREGGEG